ncbi:MAG TPA: pyrroline-5-carboxylate reductase [Spongiibacteraceae bacterium]|nr:pyrroline-5-carboxylate reductase [Spongiibacteraceae bacterium]HCS27575.1 pyrroline-5-carboxylate reductase [Spongiibacteraceae bacterium]
MSYTIAFIGGGNMASSIIGGLTASGVKAADIWASDPVPESLQRLTQVAAVNTTSDNATAIKQADVLVLAVKPQIMKSVCESVTDSVQARKPLIISIAAGIESASLENWLGGNLPVVRCMPNTPALVRCGATGLHANAAVSTEQRQRAENILAAVGTVQWFDQESALDAVTAVSGSGPAYFFLVMEAMQNAALDLGLSPEQAKALTLQTALGAATMAADSEVDVAELRRRVTSPNGTTEKAVAALEAGGLRDIFTTAITAARDRSVELARELGD